MEERALARDQKIRLPITNDNKASYFALNEAHFTRRVAVKHLFPV